MSKDIAITRSHLLLDLQIEQKMNNDDQQRYGRKEQLEVEHGFDRLQHLKHRFRHRSDCRYIHANRQHGVQSEKT